MSIAVLLLRAAPAIIRLVLARLLAPPTSGRLTWHTCLRSRFRGALLAETTRIEASLGNFTAGLAALRSNEVEGLEVLLLRDRIIEHSRAISTSYLHVLHLRAISINFRTIDLRLTLICGHA